MKKYLLLKALPNFDEGTIFLDDRGGPLGERFVCEYDHSLSQRFPEATRSEWLEEFDGKWRPKNGERYYYNDAMGDQCSTHASEGSSFDKNMMESRNVFQTYEQAAECAKLCLETREKYTESLIK